MKYTADFETTTVEPARVWLWGICEIENTDKWVYGETISDFFEQCEKLNNPTIYFHNLKFDGSFILFWLLKHHFIFRENSGDCTGHDFTTIITGDGLFYMIEIYFNRDNKRKPKKVTFYDSLKILNMPVKNVAESFNLPIKKGCIDYDRHNDFNAEVTQIEIDYLENDIKIMAMALKEMFKEGFKKITIGSCALYDYKKDIGENIFNKWFPKLSIEDDAEIRASYKGGFTFMNPFYFDKTINNGIVLDVNSLYPSVMHDKPLPYGTPIKFEGQYTKNSKYPLYTQTIRCQFELKKDMIPTIQLKHSRFFNKTEYLTTSKNNAGLDEPVTLCLTSVDLELFFKHYEVFNVEYLGGYMFKQTTKLFKKWVDKWTEKKIQATIEGNKGKRTIAKLTLNNLYGKFATNPKGEKKQPYIDEKTNKLKFKLIRYNVTDENGENILNENGEPLTTSVEMRESLYIPVGTFITAWARYITISTSQTIHTESLKKLGYSRYLYSDTDSIHLIGFDLPEKVEIHDTKLGAWKLESHFENARFLQAKRYIEEEYIYSKNGNYFIKNSYGDYVTKTKVTCAGLPASSHKYVNFVNFHIGAEYSGKLVPKQVNGGVILEETTFKLR